MDQCQNVDYTFEVKGCSANYTSEKKVGWFLSWMLTQLALNVLLVLLESLNIAQDIVSATVIYWHWIWH